MSITLDEIDASLHSIAISDGTDTLAIDGSGKITVNAAGGTDGTIIGNDNDQLKVSLKDSVHNKDIGFTAFGQLKTAQETIIADFRYDLTSIGELFDIYPTRDARYEVVNSLTGIQLTADTSGSKIEMLSKDKFYYQAGRGLLVKESAILVDTGVSGTIREWGIKDGSNGIFWRYADSTLSIVILDNGVETVINSSNFDVPVTPDGYGHLYYIQGEFLYVGNIYFYYDEELVHTYNFLGTSTSFSIGTADLRKWYKVENTANNSTICLKAGCSSVVTEGSPNAITVSQTPRKNDLAILNRSMLFGKTPPDDAGRETFQNVRVSKEGYLRVEYDVQDRMIQEEQLLELKKINFYLRQITNTDISDEELEE